MSETIIKINGGVIRQQKNTILKEVNVEINSGEFIYLIGKVGSGKSSFLKTLYAELPLEFGTGEVAGFQLKNIKKKQIPLLRRKCGIVFQDFKLLIDRSVYANLDFVLRATGWNNKKAIGERIDTVLEKVGMTDKKNKMPHQLSGGEQQRIVLARALLNAPPVILADEPTGNIDPETSYQLIELLKEICDTGKTIIIATHQYDLIERYPGRVLRCENGKLTEERPAPPEEDITGAIIEEIKKEEEETILAGEKIEIVEETSNTPAEPELAFEEKNSANSVETTEENGNVTIETQEEVVTAIETEEPAAAEVTVVTEKESGGTIETETETENPDEAPEKTEEETTVPPIIEIVEETETPAPSKEEEAEEKDKKTPVFGFDLID